MFHINPINGTDLARAVQRDYELEAAKYRFLKENGIRPGGNFVQATMTFAALIAMVTTIIGVIF